MNAQRSCECNFCPIRLRGSCSALEGMSAVTPQGMDDQALEVLRAAKSTEELLAGKVEALAGARTEYERKQKEVLPPLAHAVDEAAPQAQEMRSWGPRAEHAPCLTQARPEPICSPFWQSDAGLVVP